MSIATSRTHLGEQFSEGARLLWLALESRSWSQGQLAKFIGAQSGVVPRWLYGDTRPSWDWAAKLRDTLEIPLSAWTLEPSVAFVPPAARDPESHPDLSKVDDSGAHRATGPNDDSPSPAKRAG